MEIENSVGEKLYDVEAIINKRTVENNVIEYRVKWFNYPSKYNTWEPASNLKQVQYLIQQFEEQHNAKMEKKQVIQQQQQEKLLLRQEKNQQKKNVVDKFHKQMDDDEDQENYLQIDQEDKYEPKISENLRSRVLPNEQSNNGKKNFEDQFDLTQKAKITQIVVPVLRQQPQQQPKNNSDLVVQDKQVKKNKQQKESPSMPSQTDKSEAQNNHIYEKNTAIIFEECETNLTQSKKKKSKSNEKAQNKISKQKNNSQKSDLDNKQKSEKKMDMEEQKQTPLVNLDICEESQNKKITKLRLTGQQRNICYNLNDEQDSSMNLENNIENIAEFQVECTKEQKNGVTTKLKYKRTEDLFFENNLEVQSQIISQYLLKVSNLEMQKKEEEKLSD